MSYIQECRTPHRTRVCGDGMRAPPPPLSDARQWRSYPESSWRACESIASHLISSRQRIVWRVPGTCCEPKAPWPRATLSSAAGLRSVVLMRCGRHCGEGAASGFRLAARARRLAWRAPRALRTGGVCNLLRAGCICGRLAREAFAAPYAFKT